MDYQFAGKMERAILRPDMMPPEVHRAVTEAMRANFAAVVVPPVWVAKVATMLRGSGISVGTVVGFPHGTNKATLKAIEATSSIKDGATEIEVVAFMPNVLAGDLDAIRAELLEINRAARTTNRDVVIKVCIEMALLMQQAGDKVNAILDAATRAIRESGGDCVSLGTGFQPAGVGGAEAIVRILPHTQGLSIKATLLEPADDRAIAALIDAGANRVAVHHNP